MQVTVRDTKYGTNVFNLEAMGKPSISFGKREDCDIIIPSSFISRVHGVIYNEGGTWFIQDMQSTYGLYYMGKKVEKVPISEGTVIQIYADITTGRYVELTFWQNRGDWPVGRTTPPPQPQIARTMPDPGNDSTTFSIISLIFGIVALISVCSMIFTKPITTIILGVIGTGCGIVGLAVHRRGKGMAIAGLICGTIALLFAIIVWIKVKSLVDFSWASLGMLSFLDF